MINTIVIDKDGITKDDGHMKAIVATGPILDVVVWYNSNLVAQFDLNEAGKFITVVNTEHEFCRPIVDRDFDTGKFSIKLFMGQRHN